MAIITSNYADTVQTKSQKTFIEILLRVCCTATNIDNIYRKQITKLETSRHITQPITSSLTAKVSTKSAFTTKHWLDFYTTYSILLHLCNT